MTRFAAWFDFARFDYSNFDIYSSDCKDTIESTGYITKEKENSGHIAKEINHNGEL